jgi:hypothetical protein
MCSEVNAASAIIASGCCSFGPHVAERPDPAPREAAGCQADHGGDDLLAMQQQERQHRILIERDLGAFMTQSSDA